jgi:hypothetical protein
MRLRRYQIIFIVSLLVAVLLLGYGLPYSPLITWRPTPLPPPVSWTPTGTPTGTSTPSETPTPTKTLVPAPTWPPTWTPTVAYAPTWTPAPLRTATPIPTRTPRSEVVDAILTKAPRLIGLFEKPRHPFARLIRIQPGGVVSVTGKTPSGRWLRVRYTVNNTAYSGWVIASDLMLPNLQLGWLRVVPEPESSP